MAMQHNVNIHLPPGLSSSDVETATVSRERRRVALVAPDMFKSRFDALETRLDELYGQFPKKAHVCEEQWLHGNFAVMDALAARTCRLEALVIASPSLAPSVDEVLDELLYRKVETASSLIDQPEVERSPEKENDVKSSVHTGRCMDEFYDIVVKDMALQTSPVTATPTDWNVLVLLGPSEIPKRSGKHSELCSTSHNCAMHSCYTPRPSSTLISPST